MSLIKSKWDLKNTIDIVIDDEDLVKSNRCRFYINSTESDISKA